MGDGGRDRGAVSGLTGGKGAAPLRDGDERPARSSAVLVLLLIVATRPAALVSAAPFLLRGSMSPAVAYWLSLPVGPRQRPLGDARARLPAPHRAKDVALFRNVRHR